MTPATTPTNKTPNSFAPSATPAFLVAVAIGLVVVGELAVPLGPVVALEAVLGDIAGEGPEHVAFGAIGQSLSVQIAG